MNLIQNPFKNRESLFYRSNVKIAKIIIVRYILPNTIVFVISVERLFVFTVKFDHWMIIRSWEIIFTIYLIIKSVKKKRITLMNLKKQMKINMNLKMLIRCQPGNCGTKNIAFVQHIHYLLSVNVRHSNTTTTVNMQQQQLVSHIKHPINPIFVCVHRIVLCVKE